MTSLTAGTKFWHVLSTQGDSAPGVPANTGFSGATSATFSVTTSSVTAAATASDLRQLRRDLAVDNSEHHAAGGRPNAERAHAEPDVGRGGCATGTVTLSAAPSAATAVSLSSSNSVAASVPATVTVPAGAKSAKFTVTTKAVSTTTAVTVTAGLGGTSKTASLSVTSAAATDQVSIQQAEYVVGDQVLNVRATSSSSSATLTAYDGSSGATIGRLSNRGGGSYEGQFDWPTTPRTIVVRSSLGGAASLAVTPK